MASPFRLEPLAEHDRAGFACGEPALDRYFQTQVTQDARRRVSNCFVAVESTSGEVAAYYTLAAASIALTDLPAEVTKRLPRYPTVPAARIGRLAVAERFKKRGLGGAMLADAARKTMQSPPAVFALVVDAKNDDAVAFYEHHGFTRFSSSERTLFLPLATAEKVLLSGR